MDISALTGRDRTDGSILCGIYCITLAVHGHRQLLARESILAAVERQLGPTRAGNAVTADLIKYEFEKSLTNMKGGPV